MIKELNKYTMPVRRVNGKRARLLGTLQRREADMQKYATGNKDVFVNGSFHSRAKKLAIARRDIKALRKKLGI